MIDFNKRRVNPSHIVYVRQWYDDEREIKNKPRPMGHIYIDLITGARLHADFDDIHVSDLEYTYRQIVKQMHGAIEFCYGHVGKQHITWVRYKKRKGGSETVHLHLSNGKKLSSFEKGEADRIRGLLG